MPLPKTSATMVAPVALVALVALVAPATVCGPTNAAMGPGGPISIS